MERKLTEIRRSPCAFFSRSTSSVSLRSIVYYRYQSLEAPPPPESPPPNPPNPPPESYPPNPPPEPPPHPPRPPRPIILPRINPGRNPPPLPPRRTSSKMRSEEHTSELQ